MLIERINFIYNNYHISGYRCGNGKIPIMLLHGAGLDNAMLSWKEVMQLFGDKYTVYTYDYPGYGHSDKLPHGKAEPFYPFYINAIEEVRKQAGIDKMVVAGLSFGGCLAIGYALKYPQHVLALIPTDAWGLTEKMAFQKLTYWYLQHTHLTSTYYRFLGRHKKMIKLSIAYGLFGDKNKITNSLVDELEKLCKSSDAGVSMEDFQRNSITKNGTYPYYSQKLCNLKMPVLFINGDKDSGVPLSDAQIASNLIHGSELYIMKGCKHWSQKERPSEYTDAIKTFLDKNL